MSKRSLPSQGRPPVKRQTPNTPKATIEINQQQQQQQQGQEDTLSKAQKDYDVASVKTWTSIGQCAIVFQLYSLAVQAYESSLRHGPDSTEALVGFSKALKLLDPNLGTKQSTEVLLASLQRFPHLSNDSTLWRELAETHLASNEIEKAHQAISRALTINNNDSESLLIGAECLIKLANYQHATATLHSVIQSFSNQSQLNEQEIDILRKSHFKLAQIAALENNPKVATSEMKSALSLPPAPPSKINEQATLWAFFVTLRERTGDLEEALKISHDSLSLLGHIPKLLITNAYLLLIPNTNHYDPHQAISLLESAINQERLSQGPEKDENFLVWYLLGRAHSAVDQPREAYDAFQIALRIGPSSPLPWLAVGSLYLRMGQLPDALAAYSQAARLLVDDHSVPGTAASAAAWDGLSCVYERCDDQAHDAADACLRASSCFRAAGDQRAASQFEQRAHSLAAAASGQAPVPSLKGPPEAPFALLRELVAFGSNPDTHSVGQSSAQGPPPQLQHQTQGSPNDNQGQPQQALPPSQVNGQQSVHQRNSPVQARQTVPQQQYQQQPYPGQPQPVQRGPVEVPKQFHHLPLPKGSLVSTSRSNTPEIASKSHGTPETNRQPPHWSPVQSNVQHHQQQSEAEQVPTNGSTYYVNGQPAARSVIVTKGTPINGTPGPHAPQNGNDSHPGRLAHQGQPSTPHVVQGPIVVQHQNYPPGAIPNGQQGYLPPPGFSFGSGPQPASTPYVAWR